MPAVLAILPFFSGTELFRKEEIVIKLTVIAFVLIVRRRLCRQPLHYGPEQH